MEKQVVVVHGEQHTVNEKTHVPFLVQACFHTGPDGVPALGRRCHRDATLGVPGLALRKSPRKPGGKRHGEAPFFDAVGDGIT
jgi:hypothetical protein